MIVLVTGLVGGEIGNSFAVNDKDKKVLIQVRNSNNEPLGAKCVIEWETSDDNEKELEVQTNAGGVASGYVPSSVSKVEVACKVDDQSNSIKEDLKSTGTTVIRVMFDSVETNDDSDESNDELEIEVEVEDNTAKVEVYYDDKELEFEMDWSNKQDIIDEIASRTDLTVEEIEEVITFEFEDKVETNDDSDESNDELEIEVEVEDNTAKVEVYYDDKELEFEMDWSNKQDIIDEIASRTDLTVEEIEEVITFEFEDKVETNDDSDESNDEQTELEELREENKALRQQIRELTERLQNLELIIQEQIRVMLDTLESLKNQ